MTCDVIGSGSSGNAVVIDNFLMIDCGLPMKKIRPYAKDLRLVLLTHQHSDHFNHRTVRTLSTERPTLRWGCCEWMVPLLKAAGVDERNIDVYSLATVYQYGVLGNSLVIEAEPLFHDVLNCCYKIHIGSESVFYATDTNSLNHVSAKGFDYYLIEGNYKQAEMEARIRSKIDNGEFCYESRVLQTHMSEEDAMDWLARNMKPGSKYMFMHQHKESE